MGEKMSWFERLKRGEIGEFTPGDESFPPFLAGGEGVFLELTDRRRVTDFTSGFGVALSGHSPSFVQEEAAKGFYHGLGDYVPNRFKVELLERLGSLLGGGMKGMLLGNGADGVEAALRSASLFRKSRRMAAFEGAYHGTSLGALSVTHSPRFREKWEERLPFETDFFPYHEEGLLSLEKALKEKRYGAVILEPIQGRGGVRVPTPSFHRTLRRITEETGTPLIFDEVFTGFWKSGRLFAKDLFGVDPDLIVLGKALTSAFPLSVCFGNSRIMDAAWPEGDREASYTLTFSGNPFFCRVALRHLEILLRPETAGKVAFVESFLRRELQALASRNPERVRQVRGTGLMWALEPVSPTLVMPLIKRLLEKHSLLLSLTGSLGEALKMVPSYTMPEEELVRLIGALEKSLRAL